MAPLKQPSSLLKASLRVYGDMIINACQALEEIYGNWDFEICKMAVYEFQQLLLSQLPGKFLDAIYNECLSSALLEHIDPRIHIAVFMHEESKDIQISQVYQSNSDLRDFSFWDDILCHSNNIIYLNLGNVCSDEILRIVGNNCLSLKKIDISTSNVLDDICVSNVLEGISSPNVLAGVSDVGLLCLEKCINLEVIILGKTISRVYPRRMVTVTGVGRILKCLPNLQVFTFQDMGYVISEIVDEVESLALTQIHLTRPKVSDIVSVSTLCSNLQELCLNFSHYIPSYRRDRYPDVCDAIRTSSLHVSVLKIFGFTVTESLFKLLSVKGNFLNSFTLHGDEITGKLVQAIGESCPEIVYLDLCCEITDDISEPVSLDPKVEMFCKLESLTLRKLDFMNLNAALPVVLLHAKHIKKINVQVLGGLYDTDNAINAILKVNPMTELNELHAECILRMRTISYFFYCPQMTKLTFLQHSFITSDEVQGLEHEISKGNLDITMHAVVNFFEWNEHNKTVLSQVLLADEDF